jgi:ketosteroid isomerase-like protein
VSTPSPTGDQAGQRERNVRAVEAYFRMLNERDLDGWVELWADDARFLMPFMPEGFPNRVEGRAPLERAQRELLAAYGDYREDLQAVYPLADATRVLAQWHTTARVAAGPFTGREYDTDLVGIFRFRDDGKLVEVTEYFNAVQFLKAVGRA